jgi:hypothetical protein
MTIYSLYKKEYEILKLAETTIRNGLRENEEKQRRGTILAIVHLYLEISQENSLYHFFLSFLKIGEQEGRTHPAWGGWWR